MAFSSSTSNISCALSLSYTSLMTTRSSDSTASLSKENVINYVLIWGFFTFLRQIGLLDFSIRHDLTSYDDCTDIKNCENF
jgi:hypothetical protein